MESEEEYESFEINDHDIEGALNPGQRKYLSKKQQIYGVFAPKDEDDSEDDFDTRPRFGKVKRGKMSKNYSAPVSFVSGGIKQGDKITKPDESKDDEKNADEEDADEAYIQELLARGKFQRKRGRKFEDVLAGIRGHGTDGSKYGDWERYTKGIGTKLMEKMGFEHGKGLGRESQGIVEPVQVSKRPGRGAVGAYGQEISRPKVDVENEVIKAEKAQDDSKYGSWRKTKQKKETVQYG